MKIAMFAFLMVIVLTLAESSGLGSGRRVGGGGFGGGFGRGVGLIDGANVRPS